LIYWLFFCVLKKKRILFILFSFLIFPTKYSSILLYSVYCIPFFLFSLSTLKTLTRRAFDFLFPSSNHRTNTLTLSLSLSLSVSVWWRRKRKRRDTKGEQEGSFGNAPSAAGPKRRRTTAPQRHWETLTGRTTVGCRSWWIPLRGSSLTALTLSSPRFSASAFLHHLLQVPTSSP